MRLKRVGGRALAVGVVSVAGLVLAPASGQAATTIGSGLGTPTADDCVPGQLYSQGLISGDNSTTYDIPTSAVITSWAVRVGAGGGQGALKVMARDQFTSPPPVATYSILQSSAIENITTGTVNRFSTRIPVPGGGEIGYQPLGGNQKCLLDPDSAGLNDDQNVVINGPGTGEVGSQYTTNSNNAFRGVNIQATFEPDADVDGFGDETQDRCPGVAGPTDGCATLPPPPPDVTKPTLGGLSFSRSSFAAAKSGASFSAKKRKKKSSAPVGTKVSFTLSEPGSVTFTAERKTSGRKVKGKCKTKTRKNRKKAKCDLYKKVSGSFTVPGKAGANSFTFRGRIGGKALRRGDYRLNGTAKDPANNVSVPKRKGFKIVT